MYYQYDQNCIFGSKFYPEIYKRGILFIGSPGKISNLKKESSEIVSEESLAELKSYLSKKKVPHDGFHFKEVDEDDMKKLIKHLKGKKASGLDWICS